MNQLVSEIISAITSLSVFRESIEELAAPGSNGVFTLKVEEKTSTHIGGAGDVCIYKEIELALYEVYGGNELLSVSINEDASYFLIIDGCEIYVESLEELSNIATATMYGFIGGQLYSEAEIDTTN